MNVQKAFSVIECLTVKHDDSKTSFYQLDPDLVLAATEEAGFQPTGEFSQLNSYENRVFDIKLEPGQDQARVIAKFYRPGRWSEQALQEEHDFLFDLDREGIPVVAPLLLQKNKKSLLEVDGMFVTFFPKCIGRMPDELLKNDLYQVGRRLAQIHNIGARRPFKHRAVIGEFPYTPEDNLDFLSRWVAPELWPRYRQACEQIIDFLDDELDSKSFIRIHGDCHRGNLLSRPVINDQGNAQNEFFFVDFDDSAMGPEVQDFWMLLTGADGSEESDEERDLILSGYEELREFPDHQWGLIPGLRGLRIFNYAAWIARRWEDPSFHRIFTEFNTYTYWAEETEALERIAWSFS
jgi:Ser/Thr protein kinase RdoA (MazF antagonist)